MSMCTWYCDVTDIYKNCAAPIDVDGTKTKRLYVILDEFWNEKIRDLLKEFSIIMQPIPVLVSEPLEGLAFPEFYVSNVKFVANFITNYEGNGRFDKKRIYIWIKATCEVNEETIKILNTIVAKFGGYFVKNTEWIEITKAGKKIE